jgi:hypothetical protein
MPLKALLRMHRAKNFHPWGYVAAANSFNSEASIGEGSRPFSLAYLSD